MKEEKITSHVGKGKIKPVVISKEIMNTQTEVTTNAFTPETLHIQSFAEDPGIIDCYYPSESSLINYSNSSNL